MDSSVYHIPALGPETIEGLAIRKDGIYVDATFGGGGHSRLILKELGKEGHLYGFDQDIDARANSIDDPRFTFVLSNFRYIRNFLRFYGTPEVDGILADLGVSFHHFDDSSRGFSFRFDGNLDMRMNRNSGINARNIVNEYSEEQLANIFHLYGELKQARKIASAIGYARKKKEITTTSELVGIVEPLIKADKQKKELAMVFQALRIEINDEIGALKDLLKSAITCLKPGGRIAIITYHSLEDRLVKNFFRAGNIEGKIEKDFYGNIISPLRTITSKAIVPSDEEIERNPRSRSAKLRIAEKI